MTLFQIFLMVFGYTIITHIIDAIFMWRSFNPYFHSLQSRLDQQEKLLMSLLEENIHND